VQLRFPRAILGGTTERTINLRLDEALAARLDAFALRARKPAESVAQEALAAFLELDAWQVSEIEAALREADEGAFLTDEELAAAYARRTV
jgi:RHH-type transcriptional regulator, rel operon repressor / antitoxin RelB